MSERIRLTITVSQEVHEVFSRMAQSGGVSLGRCMGDWLADTLDGAQFVAQKMAEAKTMPRTVMREMQAITAGLHEVVSDQVSKGAGQRGAHAPGARGGPMDGTAAQFIASLSAKSARRAPPSSNTGGKSPRKTLGPQGGKAATK